MAKKFDKQRTNQPQRLENFDADWYVREYPDVALTGLSPQQHFLKYGPILKRPGAPANRSVQQESKSLHQGLSPSPQELAQALVHSPVVATGVAGPLISVIIPSYNNAQFLEACVNSALSQQDVSVEVIIVDDASTDTSPIIAGQLASRHHNVRFISLLTNFGCYYARNVGIQNARGDYVCFIDSDDIMDPRRLTKQLSPLQRNPKGVATWCKLRRWSADFSESLSEPKFGEITLFCRRSLFDQVGLFDSVRFGGDAEFRHRTKRVLGNHSVISLNEELYYARTVSGSLTLDEEHGVFLEEDGALKNKSSEARKLYEGNYLRWHKTLPAGKFRKHIEFPLYKRPFELGVSAQNAAPSLDVRRIACMATFPQRLPLIKKVLDRILPQVDELRIYFNEYDKLPPLPNDPKIKPYLGVENAGDLKDYGKFYDLPPDDCYIFTIDDDIIYPKDYVSRMVYFIEMFQRKCAVGAHGVIFPREKCGYLENRRVLHFKEAIRGEFVDLLGTGVLAFHSSLMKLSKEVFKTTGICDLWFAVAAHKSNVPLFCVPHDRDWIRPQPDDGPKLYQQALKGHGQSIADDLYHANLWPLVAEEPRQRAIYQELLQEQKSAEALNGANIKSPVSLSPAFKRVRNIQPEQRNSSTINFHLVINGWNCGNFVWPCLASIANQQLGNYSLRVTIVNDGSPDDTLDKILNFGNLPNAEVLNIKRNMGPAFAREQAIRQETDPNVVMVLLDLDDELTLDALNIVSKHYRANKNCMMTIGNWRNQKGKVNPQPFYSSDELDERLVRQIPLFNATALRTFRRKLYDAVLIDDLTGPHGEWLETCTDVAIMFPLLDQCFARNVEFISQPIYIYNQKLSQGTLARFGKPHKIERLEWLRNKKQKPRFAGA